MPCAIGLKQSVQLSYRWYNGIGSPLRGKGQFAGKQLSYIRINPERATAFHQISPLILKDGIGSTKFYSKSLITKGNFPEYIVVVSTESVEMLEQLGARTFNDTRTVMIIIRW